jgi:hypothetical protein
MTHYHKDLESALLYVNGDHGTNLIIIIIMVPQDFASPADLLIMHPT